VFLLGALSVQIGAELGFDPAALGLVVSAYFGVSALVSLPVGKLVERIGSRLTSRIGLVGAAVVMLLTALFARDYAAVVVLVLLGAPTNVMGQL
ncbi:MFS transporter, partial [Staphylococcus aureus]|uniref:MFS transporter n=1 Tax=Staphylococcus aureus TaxID=1280 RepID=UPI003A7F63C6